jgi:hypothetical protein
LCQLLGCGRVDVNFLSIAGIHTGRNDQPHKNDKPYGYHFSAVLHFILLSIEGLWLIPMPQRRGIFKDAAQYFLDNVNNNLLLF